MPVVGVAEVLVRPSFKGFQAELAAAVDKTVPAQEKRTSKLGKAIGTGLKRGALLGVAGTGALLGTALTKGFGRLVAIENAQAKLRGLGHDAETVEKIMGNANASVKGTAFGLDEAATVAANAVAAGVQPGEDLEKTLKLVADASTIAGTEMGEMGAIFNKVAAADKVQMDVINQLHDAGVPALQLLAKEMGVTAEEASKMASKGEIDFATFQKAMESGLGGAAQESGKTLQGAFKNTMAALGRFGANLLSGVYPKVKEFFQGAIEMMKPMEENAKVWGEAIGDAIVGFIDWIGEAIRIFREWLPLITIVTGALTGFFAALAIYKAYTAYVGWLNGMTLATRLWATAQKGLNLAFLANPFTWVAVAVGALVAAFIWAYKNVDWFREGVDKAMGSIIQWFKDAGRWIGDVFGGLVNWIQNDVVPWFGRMAEAIGAGWKGAQDASASAGNWIGGIFEAIGSWIGGIINGFKTFGIAVAEIWNSVVGAIRTAWEFISGVFTAIVSSVVSFLAPGFNVLRDVVTTVFKVIWDTISWWGSVVRAVFELIVGVVRFVLAAAFTWLLESVIRPVWSAISGAISAAWGFISGIFTAIVTRVTTGLGRIFTWLRDSVILPVWNAITGAIRTAWGFISGIFNSVVSFVRGVLAAAFTWYLNTIIIPVFLAVRSAISTAWGFISGIFNSMISFIRTTLGNAFTWFRDSVVRPVFDQVGNLAKGLFERVTGFLGRIGDFFVKTLPDMIKKGVKIIGDAWKSVGEFFAKPIRWVLENVWDGGIKKAFDSVAKAVGIDTRLPSAPKLGFYAKGGKVKEDWYVAGEDGPELIHRGADSHRVYTAEQTRRMLSSGKEDLPEEVARFAVGSRPSESMVPAGGFLGAIGKGLSTLDDVILGGAGKKAISWIGGMLADGARQLVKPLIDGVRKAMGSFGSIGDLASGWIGNVVDGLFKWAEKKDDEAPVEGSTGEMFDGGPGGFHRPSSGRITSYYGPRWGSVHEGIDLAGGGVTRAAWDGIVQKVGWNIGPGRTGIGIHMNHGPGLWSYHGHNPVGGVRVRPGQKVKGGQIVGAEGATGNVTGRHLHWEVHRGAPWRSVNPLALLRDNGGTVPPGVQLVANLSGKDELMLNHRDALRTAEALRGEGSGNRYEILVNKSNATGDDIAEAIEFRSRRNGRV